jgi:ABC-type lipoprotein export system ATPase subunit
MFGFAENLMLIVGKADVGAALVVYICVCMCLSVVGYVESTYMAYVMTDPESVYYYLLIIGITKTINPLFEYASTLIYKRHIMTKLSKTSYSYYWYLVIDAHPDWLMENKKIHTHIEKGINAVTQTFGATTVISRPMFRFISSLMFIVSITSIGYVCVLGAGLVIGLGYYLTYQNHIKQKHIKTKHENFINMANDQAMNILNRVLNYKGQQVVDNIIKAFTNQQSEFAEQIIVDEGNFVMIDILLSIMQVSLVALIVYCSNDVKLTPVIYMAIRNVRGATWELMCRARMISERSSGWGPLEKSLKTYKTYTKKHNILNLTIPMNSNEVQLFGPSGCGKTTFMKKTIIDLFINSHPGQFIYMDQHMRLIKTGRTILSVMSDDLPHPFNMNIQALLFFSEMLQITKIINASTLNLPFHNGVSGGEEKRIMILRTLLPLILKVHSVKVVFNDEITAGLDDEAWEQARELVNMLKSQGIKFITIDHHHIKGIERINPSPAF